MKEATDTFVSEFQSTRPRGARRRISTSRRNRRRFQSTRPRGARPVMREESRRAFQVSIHAPARGATRLHEIIYFLTAVSIHAPARGATAHAHDYASITDVSIHAPARGATGSRAWRFGNLASFNPRAREGRDSSFLAGRSGSGVSIHAPARGATERRASARLCCTRFQSTRPRGARLRDIRYNQDRPRFQSTRPRGARRQIKPDRFIVMPCFNPRAREGRDSRGHNLPAPLPNVSIHAPARGATRDRRGDAVLRMFQSTRPRGARPVVLYDFESVEPVFQSTRPRGARLRVCLLHV